MQFKERLTTLVLALALCGAAAGGARAEGVEMGADMGVVSQYVWRGVTQSGGKPAVQGDLSAALGGLSAGVWFSNAYPASAKWNGRDVVEFDWTLDYSGSAGRLGYSVGGIYYTYLYDGPSNFVEAYAGASLDAPLAPSLTAYYTLSDSGGKAYLGGDLWIDLGVSGAAAGFDLSGTLSYVSWTSDAGRVADNYQDGLSALALGASKDIAHGDVTLTPSITLTVPLASDSADGMKYIYGTQAEMEFIAGLNVAY